MNQTQIIEDNSVEWWKAGEIDDYDVSKKILRTGCRQLQRQLVECKQLNFQQINKCQSIRTDLMSCQGILEHLILNQK